MATPAPAFSDDNGESEYTPATEDYTGGGTDEGGDEVESDSSAQSDELDRLNKLQKHLEDSINAAYGGQEAAASWKGTTAIGLSAFQGHRQDRNPILDKRGRVTGFSSAPGAPMANVPEGLIGGRALENQAKGVDISDPFNAALTPEKDWRSTFGAKQGAAPLKGTLKIPDSPFATNNLSRDPRQRRFPVASGGPDGGFNALAQSGALGVVSQYVAGVHAY
jgi:hypothetical protein